MNELEKAVTARVKELLATSTVVRIKTKEDLLKLPVDAGHYFVMSNKLPPIEGIYKYKNNPIAGSIFEAFIVWKNGTSESSIRGRVDTHLFREMNSDGVTLKSKGHGISIDTVTEADMNILNPNWRKGEGHCAKDYDYTVIPQGFYVRGEKSGQARPPKTPKTYNGKRFLSGIDITADKWSEYEFYVGFYNNKYFSSQFEQEFREIYGCPPFVTMKAR